MDSFQSFLKLGSDCWKPYTWEEYRYKEMAKNSWTLTWCLLDRKFYVWSCCFWIKCPPNYSSDFHFVTRLFNVKLHKSSFADSIIRSNKYPLLLLDLFCFQQARNWSKMALSSIFGYWLSNSFFINCSWDWLKDWDEELFAIFYVVCSTICSCVRTAQPCLWSSWLRFFRIIEKNWRVTFKQKEK